MSYVMDLHEAHKARLSRMGNPTPRRMLPAPVLDLMDVDPPKPAREPYRGPLKGRAIIAAVCSERGVSVDAVMSEQRHKAVSEARHEIFYHLHAYALMSLSRIGRIMNRDHTTVYHGIQRHKKRMGIE